MLIPHDHNFISISTIFVRKLDADVMVITDFVDGGSFAANDVGMELGININGHLVASQLLFHKGGREEGREEGREGGRGARKTKEGKEGPELILA